MGAAATLAAAAAGAVGAVDAVARRKEAAECPPPPADAAAHVAKSDGRAGATGASHRRRGTAPGRGRRVDGPRVPPAHAARHPRRRRTGRLRRLGRLGRLLLVAGVGVMRGPPGGGPTAPAKVNHLIPAATRTAATRPMNPNAVGRRWGQQRNGGL